MDCNWFRFCDFAVWCVCGFLLVLLFGDFSAFVVPVWYYGDMFLVGGFRGLRSFFALVGSFLIVFCLRVVCCAVGILVFCMF